MKKDGWFVILFLLIIATPLLVAVLPDPPDPNRLEDPIGGGEIGDVAVEPIPDPPPEGYPALPEGWEWVPMINERGDRWYEATGWLGGSPRCPFDAYVTPTASKVNGSIVYGLRFRDAQDEGGASAGKVIVFLLNATSSLIEWGDRVEVEASDVLLWLKEEKVSIYFPPATRAEGSERMNEIINWLLGNE